MMSECIDTLFILEEDFFHRMNERLIQLLPLLGLLHSYYTLGKPRTLLLSD